MSYNFWVNLANGSYQEVQPHPWFSQGKGYYVQGPSGMVVFFTVDPKTNTLAYSQVQDDYDELPTMIDMAKKHYGIKP